MSSVSNQISSLKIQDTPFYIIRISPVCLSFLGNKYGTGEGADQAVPLAVGQGLKTSSLLNPSPYLACNLPKINSTQYLRNRLNFENCSDPLYQGGLLCFARGVDLMNFEKVDNVLRIVSATICR